ncbi:MAG: hypothetical protein JXK92_00975, partial [Erysipelotrichaceae bacterium]|nr:hypothetical protein [Erysipelotrichaceae bacterium]
THLSVAVQVSQGSADCGLGIYSAAKIYGLDFIPLCEEDYDFILRADMMDDPRTHAFLACLHHPDFAEKLTSMGGYTLDELGRIIEWRNTND